MKKGIKIAGLIAILVWIIFQFMITTYKMENHTMESTIKKGERLWINKLSVGAYFLGLKLPGLSTLEHNDVIYYAYPEDFDKPIYAKRRFISRLIGKPGDRIQINFSDVTVNKQLLQTPKGLQKAHRVMLKPNTNKKDFFKKLGINQATNLIDSLGIFEVPLCEVMVEKLRKNQDVDYVRMIRQRRGGANRIFPKNPFVSWSEDNFGPLTIPKKGDVIKLNYRNIGFYKNIIDFFEGNTFKQHNKEIYINGKLSNSYTIKNNYYFVLDDNRDKMFDSREFGFVPESYVLGKVIGID
jgi:signal peptidase I